MNQLSSTLQPSVFGKAPMDRITKLIADFIFPYLEDSTFEIEAKFGVIIDKHTGNRVNFPIKTETVILEDNWFRFESNMSMSQHAQYNKLLNDRVSESGSLLKYKHTKEIDEFYQDNARKVRVTRNASNMQIIRTIIKEKVADMHIFIPYSSLDCRISVNREVVISEGISGKATSIRRKDRLSYIHQDIWQVDLTQVQNEDNKSQLSHELELEIRDKSPLAAEARKAACGEANKYLHLVSVFLNNIKALSIKAESK